MVKGVEAFVQRARDGFPGQFRVDGDEPTPDGSPELVPSPATDEVAGA